MLINETRNLHKSILFYYFQLSTILISFLILINQYKRKIKLINEMS